MRNFVLVSAILVAAPIMADDQQDAPPKVYADLAACRALTEAEKRLACFDATAAAMEQARQDRELVMLDRVAVKKAKKSLFGFPIPDIPLLEGGDDEDEEEEITEITSTLASVRELGYGKWQFTIPDGGTWQTTESSQSILREGQTVTIKRSLVGGYMMKVGKGALRPVKRLK